MKMISRFPDTPDFTDEQIQELTRIVFLEPTEPQKCDIIFVFGGTHPSLWEYAYKAYQEQLGKVVLATGGSARPKYRNSSWVYDDVPESHLIVERLTELGVPPGDILFEDRSTNSLENVLYAREILDFNSISSILFVCKCYGAGRQYRTLKQNIPAHIMLCPYPFDAKIVDRDILVTRDKWMNNEVSRSFVFSAYLRILYYGNRGDILPLEKPIEGLERRITCNWRQ
jgi:uncharacterized SAM-binding protein YcdF (DUF218 family)